MANSGINFDAEGNCWGHAQIECAIRAHADGTFGVYFESLDPMAFSQMVHPDLFDTIMPRVYEAAEELEKGATS